jgi:hypothetical protein
MNLDFLTRLSLCSSRLYMQNIANTKKGVTEHTRTPFETNNHSISP